MLKSDGERTPAGKLLIAVLVAAALAVPIFMVWFLVYDRQSQSEQAVQSITAGWGGPQAMTGPVLVIPYRGTATETVIEGGRSVTRSRDVMRELTLAPEAVQLTSDVRPERRKRSIYEAVVYDSKALGRARFAFPPDLERTGVALADMQLARAELRFGLSDPRGLGANPKVAADGRQLRLQPGGGSGGGRGFFAWLDASALTGRPMTVDFAFDFRGTAALSLVPQAGDTQWLVRSSWPHPSFAGDFLPGSSEVGSDGFRANYRVGNLALGRSLVSTGDAGASNLIERVAPPSRAPMPRAPIRSAPAGPSRPRRSA
ncbi:inner membrane CreD family protein [Sphingomonas lutea]|uniref:inner membrane CreD family protein n=1 Tax=Sphingomonas lutea TaxID=1045317 RepID=UPI002467B1B3|nr:inner membrane CreD family protein [Sphingomonas lutea]